MRCSFALLGYIHGEREALHIVRGNQPCTNGSRWGKGPQSIFEPSARQGRNMTGPDKTQASPSHPRAAESLEQTFECLLC